MCSRQIAGTSRKFMLPLTHPGTYRVSFMAQPSGLVTLEIITVFPLQRTSTQVQTDPVLDIRHGTETPRCSKGEQPVHTSDCGEKSLSSSLFTTPVKVAIKDGPDIDDSVTEPESDDEQVRTALANGDGLITLHSLSLSSQPPSLSQDTVSTFILMRRMEAGFGNLPRGINSTQSSTFSRSPSPTMSTPGAKRLKLEMD